MTLHNNAPGLPALLVTALFHYGSVYGAVHAAGSAVPTVALLTFILDHVATHIRLI